MDYSYIAVWLPVFVVLFIIIPRQTAAVKTMINRKKGRIAMTNELVKKYVGRYCYVTTGNMGVSVSGKIIEVNENWIELETKKGIEVINLDYIQNIKVK